MNIQSSHRLLILTCALFAAGPALAWNPNEGAEIPPPRQMRQRLPQYVVPARYYSTPAVAPAIPVANAAPAAMPVNPPAPAPIAYQPPVITSAPVTPAIAPPPPVAPRQIPVEQFTPAYPAATAPAQQTYSPAYQPAAVTAAAPMQTQNRSFDANRFSFGVEGFYNDYEESTIDMQENGYYGGINASYSHYFDPEWFAALELGWAAGSVDYKSPSGTDDGKDQWETENRLLVGYHNTYGGSRYGVKPYIGLGMRYFSDRWKDSISSLGAFGYDRRIFQVYAPIGVTYEFPAWGVVFAPNVEIDPLLYGSVSSRLGNVPGFQNLQNHQHSGIGLRGEFMVRHLNENNQGWEFGPFIRYWDVPDSDIDSTPAFTGLEPENTRLQAGAKLKVLF